jgi:GT2 family glycosyltransferase
VQGPAGDEGVLVSVLVPVYNESEHLREAAATMLGQQLDGRFELIFIDGDSEDATPALLEDLAEDPRVRVLHNQRRTTPTSLNMGLAAAQGRYVARMDAHALYPRTYLARGVERLRSGGAAHVSGPQLAVGREGWSRSVALALQSRAGTGAARFRRGGGSEFEVDSGFTGIWERETLVAHGGWDEQWPVNQDAELAARIRATGGRIVCLPELAAEYIPRASLTGLARQYFRYGIYRCRTSVRHPSSLRAAHLLPPSLTLTAGAALVRGPQRRLACAALAAYGCALAATGAVSARRSELTEAPRVALVLLTMHTAWGAGMWLGALESVRRGLWGVSRSRTGAVPTGGGDGPRASEARSRRRAGRQPGRLR